MNTLKWQLMAGLVMMLFIGAPLLLLNLGALGRMAQFEELMGDGRTSVPGPIADAGKRADDAFGRFIEGNRVNAIFSTDALARARAVVIERGIGVEEVLEEGEAAPDPALAELYIATRTPTMMMAECDLMLATLATACGVATADVDRLSDGRFRVGATLAYVPDYPMGNPDIEGPRDLYARAVNLTEGQRVSITLGDRADFLKAIYQAAEIACGDLRDEVGNCVIGRLTIDERPGRDDETLEIAARAVLNYVGPRGDGVGETITDRVTAQLTDQTEVAEARSTGLLGAIAALFASQTGTGGSGSGSDVNVIRGGGGGHWIQARER